tara:strand:+ start:1008 stop:1142 length:135 start_codon:yes stop_codon:yes gene_type:complete
MNNFIDEFVLSILAFYSILIFTGVATYFIEDDDDDDHGKHDQET